MKDFVANIEIQVLEGKLWVTLKTDKWEGWAITDDGFIVAEDDPPEELEYIVEIAVERLLSDKSPWEEEAEYETQSD